jgi:hypothetical protein
MQAVVLHVGRMKYPCDVSDHQFYHKWALLLDPNYKKNDVRGFLKCDVTVIGKGEKIKVHKPVGCKDEDNIEG